MGTILSAMAMMTSNGLLIGIILFFLAPWLAVEVFSEPKAIWPLRFVAILLPLRAINMVLVNVLVAFEKMKEQVLTTKFYINAAKMVVALALVVYLPASQGYIGAAAGYAFGFGSALVVSYYFARKYVSGIFSPSVDADYNYGELFHHSWPLLAAGLFGMITGHIDTFMLQAFKGSTEVGLYQGAYPFAALLTVGVGMFASIFLSNASKLIASEEIGELRSTYRALVKWVSLVTVPVFVIMFAFPRSVLVVFGSEYFAVENALRMLSIGFLLSSLTGPVAQIYQAMDRTKLNFYTSVLIAVANGCLNYLFIPRTDMFGGAMGASIASTLAFVVLVAVEIILLYRLLGIQPFRFSVLKVWVSASVSILAIWGLTNMLFQYTPLWFFVVDLVLFSAIYGMLVLVLGTIEEEDLVVLRAIRDKLGLELEWAEELVRRFS
jgi:O-antigen/teichoic acid export membrane protein